MENAANMCTGQCPDSETLRPFLPTLPLYLYLYLPLPLCLSLSSGLLYLWPMSAPFNFLTVEHLTLFFPMGVLNL